MIVYPNTVLYAKSGKSYYYRHEGLFTPEGIAHIEEKKNAKFVCDTCLFGKEGWTNAMVAVFWNKDPANIPAGGSAWFGIFKKREFAVSSYLEKTPAKARVTKSVIMITNAISVHNKRLDAVVADDGEVVWSRYRHDYRSSGDKSVWIDGGRDYMRWSGQGETVRLEVVEGDLTIVENWETIREEGS